MIATSSLGVASPLKIAASYARKSDKNQPALADQHEINILAAAKDGFHVPPHLCFGDDDTTGVSIRRDGWDQVLAMIEAGDPPFERLYAVIKDRIGRFNDPGYHDYIRIHLERHGVALRYSRGPNPDYSKGMTLETRAHALDDRLTSIKANDEWHDIRERTRKGVRTQVKHGFYPGTTAPYGTVRWLAHEETRALVQEVQDGIQTRMHNHRYVLRWKDDSSVAIIRRIFEMVDSEDLPVQQIATWLTEAGIPRAKAGARSTRTAPHPAWRPETVMYILRNRIYQGDFLWGSLKSGAEPVPAADADPYGDEPILYRDFIADAPISRDQFARVQEILDRRGESPVYSRHSRPQFLLSGRLRCATCGASWGGHTSTAKLENRRRYYRHHPNSEGGKGPLSRTVVCTSKTRYVRAADLEAQIITDVLLTAFTEEVQQAILTELQRQAANPELDPAKLAKIDSTISDTQGHLQRASLAMSMETNKDAAAAHQAAIDIHAGTLAKLRHEREALLSTARRAEAARRSYARAILQAEELPTRFRSAAPEQQKALLRQLISRIDLDADHNAVNVEVLFGMSNSDATHRNGTEGTRRRPGTNRR